MMTTLHNLHPAPGSKQKIKRLGRGNASGRGTTAGKGTKGQRARQGGRKNLRQIGMKQTIRSTPKLGGFASIYKKTVALPVSALNNFKSGATITFATLVKAHLVAASAGSAKFVDGGKVNVKLTINGIKATANAKKKIEAAGGTFID
jgi:large subunit ribosomal protein L15